MSIAPALAGRAITGFRPAGPERGSDLTSRNRYAGESTQSLGLAERRELVSGLGRLVQDNRARSNRGPRADRFAGDDSRRNADTLRVLAEELFSSVWFYAGIATLVLAYVFIGASRGTR